MYRACNSPADNVNWVLLIVGWLEYFCTMMDLPCPLLDGSPSPFPWWISLTLSIMDLPRPLHGGSPSPSPWCIFLTFSLMDLPHPFIDGSPSPFPWWISHALSMMDLPHPLHTSPSRTCCRKLPQLPLTLLTAGAIYRCTAGSVIAVEVDSPITNRRIKCNDCTLVFVDHHEFYLSDQS